MAHNIEVRNGIAQFAAVGSREDVWHRLGQYKVPENGAKGLTWTEMAERSGLTWGALKIQNTVTLPDGTVIKVNRASIIRDCDNMELGSVGLDYSVFQIQDAFQFVDSLVEVNGGTHYDTAGALDGGKKIFVSVRVPKADIEVVPGDTHTMSLIFATSFDGSLSNIGKLSATRPVCQNTLMAALKSSGAMFKVKHTANANARMDRAKDLMQGVVMDAAKLGDKLKALATRKLTKESFTAICDRLFPKPKEEKANTTRRENVLAEIVNLYQSNDNQAFPQIAGSGYNLLNAITEYTDHFRTARMTDGRGAINLDLARAENAVIGTGDVLKSRALEIILEETNGAPSMHSVTVESSGSLLDAVLANHSNN